MYEQNSEEALRLVDKDMFLVATLRGIGDIYFSEGAKSSINQWRIEQENLVERLKGVAYKRAQVILEIKQAKIFRAAGFLSESNEILKQEVYRARQEGFLDLLEVITRMISTS